MHVLEEKNGFTNIIFVFYKTILSKNNTNFEKLIEFIKLLFVEV